MIYYFLPLFIWGGVIVFASTQPYEQQDARPVVGSFDLSWVERWFSWVSFTYSESIVSIETRGTAGFIEFFIRKGAHLVVFFVLAFLMYRFLRLFSLKTITRATLTLGFIVIFAAVDEFRHLLHPNRTGLVEDVVLDTIGGMLGIALALFVYRKKLCSCR
ncbi:VanZ family protein [Desertibacillus haloalkaliphilus]|nr:VanZ family protein [Desertibacillus haloalkaliphilus]